jgi:V/A-type H+-transporting ATPase subunit D
VSVEKVELGEENIVGTMLPTLERIDVAVKDYALMTRPHWVDPIVARLHDMLELRLRVQVEERRLELLDRAVKTITQRVNLFDKVLIPQAKTNIKKIRIYLSDEEMAAVVRSKISKSKRAREHGA